jgi:hypothetical protein
MTKPATNDWLKGGLRYAKLKKVVPAYLAPEPVEAFFVAVTSRGRLSRLLNPLSPLQREYVVAATPRTVFVLKLKRPGVFRASIGGVVHEALRDTADCKWIDDKLVLDGVDYWPISFHGEDAEALASLISRSSSPRSV